MSGLCKPSEIVVCFSEICSSHSDFQRVLWPENDWAITMSFTEPNCAQQNHFCLTAFQILEGVSWFFFHRTHPSNWPLMVNFQILSLVWILYHECISGFLYSSYTRYMWHQAQHGEDGTGSTLASDPNPDTFLAFPLSSPPRGPLELIWVLGWGEGPVSVIF